MSERKGPFKLVTVNTAPDRARRRIAHLIEALKDDYDIEHVDNCQSMCGVIIGSAISSTNSLVRRH